VYLESIKSIFSSYPNFQSDFGYEKKKKKKKQGIFKAYSLVYSLISSVDAKV